MTISENRYKIVYETLDTFHAFYVIMIEGDYEPIVLKTYITDICRYVCFYDECMYEIELKDSVPLHCIVDSIMNGWEDINGTSWIHPYI